MKNWIVKYNWIFSLWLLLLGITACEEKLEVALSMPTVEIQFPQGITTAQVCHDTLSFYNISSGYTQKTAATAPINLPNGFYNIYYQADIQEGVGISEEKGRLVGALENVIIDHSTTSFTLEAEMLMDKNDFIIEEIFFTGTLTPKGKQYHGDSYLKIYNDTDHVLYADGLAFVESKFLSTKKYIFTPNIQKDTMTVHAIYVIPGKGNEYPVQPGESLTLCDTGIDHKVSNANSIDLRTADFEWYDVSSSPSFMDIDSKDVENLDKWYCYTQTVFIPHNRGFRSYALVRIPIDKQEYLSKYFYRFNYLVSTPQGNFPMSDNGYKIPNEWITDGVNCSVETEWQGNVLPVTIDGGWTHCGKMDNDKNRYFKSVRRKMIALDSKGNRILKDTNNSSEDFNTECVPSLFEAQQASINAQGDKSEQMTYDGVQVIKNNRQ